MKKLAVINDLSGLGKCSLTAAIPVISVLGVQAVPLPTAVLSNQTGYDSYYVDDYTDRMEAIMEEWEKRGFSPDGIYTGFLAGEEQGDRILSFFRRFRKRETLVLVDPVMGDGGAVFKIYSQGLLSRMQELAGQADVITPNLTESLLLLYGYEGMRKAWEELMDLSWEEAQGEVSLVGERLVKRFSCGHAVITGVDVKGERPGIGNLVCQEGRSTWILSEKKGGSYSGTGDLFASVLGAGLVRGIPMEFCVREAAEFLGKAIEGAVKEGTDRNDGVCFEPLLCRLGERFSRYEDVSGKSQGKVVSV